MTDEHAPPIPMPYKDLISISVGDATQDMGEVTRPFPIDAPDLTIRSDKGPPVITVELSMYLTRDVISWIREVSRYTWDAATMMEIQRLLTFFGVPPHKLTHDRSVGRTGSDEVVTNLYNAAQTMAKRTGVRGWVVTLHEKHMNWHIVVYRDEDGFRRASPSFDKFSTGGSASDMDIAIDTVLTDMAIIWKGWYSR